MALTIEKLEAANTQISVRIREAIEERDRIEAEITTLQNSRLENTKAINRLLRTQIAQIDEDDDS